MSQFQELGIQATIKGHVFIINVVPYLVPIFSQM